ncbi:glycoside hydrolase [Aspergillus ruber CBS 135680]|uniref:chitinase n=1 Tax=Aspergillus ruber (strain CBS 135680) TaxID=1388766 RepID=A0A017SNH3_ASPRC|nr:glycoside hydrolase [Aspergillus ruber CBS 135680]EYE98492.1 glycoside hydrolase [Aspergillus ruber CBS 135680]
MAFVMSIHGPGGAPVYDLANTSKECDTFDGTNLKNCPEVGEDIAECQKNGKTILLSIGGATYKEAGFSSEKEAIAGAESIWKTFGPNKENGPVEEPSKNVAALGQTQSNESQKPAITAAPTTATPNPQSAVIATGTNAAWNNPNPSAASQASQNDLWPPQATYLTNLVPQLLGRAYGAYGASGPASVSSQTSKVHRPFGKTSVDGFDLDFEATNYNMQPFAKRLRELMEGESDRKYYLTSAPQCPYPDAADKDFLDGPGPVDVDAVFVQFYNNPCGLKSFDANSDEQPQFNFKTWDDWAKDGSKNKDVKVLLGVPANEEASVSGFVPISELKPIIEYAQGFDSFGGAMVWDVTQAHRNKGFLSSVRQTLTQSASLFRKQRKMSLAPIRLDPRVIYVYICLMIVYALT